MTSAEPPQSLQSRLKAIIDGAHDAWTYAIFWRHCSSGVLAWADGYFNEDHPKPAVTSASAAEQKFRRSVVRELHSSVSDSGDAIIAEKVTDAEWFFLISMSHSCSSGAGEELPRQALLGADPIWIAGADELAAFPCERVRRGQSLGIRTMACIPTEDGVIELGSTDVIVCQCPDLVNDVRVSFSFR